MIVDHTHMANTSNKGRSFLDINPLKLDEEWLEQPKLYFEKAEEAADARRRLDNAKTAYDVAKARKDQFIRRNPAKYGLDAKPTQSAIAAKVDMDPTVQEAGQAVVDAKYDADIAQAAVVALDHRKRALTMLVELHQSNYFAEPRVSNQASRGLDKADILQRTLAKKTKVRMEKREDD